MSAPLDPEEVVLVNMAIGRLFRMLSRPAQSGDVEDYFRCRSVVLDATDKLPPTDSYQVNWTRDRLKGAAGD